MTAFEIVLSILASVGGIGAVLTAVIKFSSNFIAKRLEERYSLKLNKELEKYKSIAKNKNYISKTKFDTEFKIYRSFSRTFFEMVKYVGIMIPAGFSNQPVDKEDRIKWENSIYESANTAYVRSQDILNSNAPFVPDELFNKYDGILQLCRLQPDAFERRWNVSYSAPRAEKESFVRKDYERSREISESFASLNNMVRAYLSNLDVIE